MHRRLSIVICCLSLALAGCRRAPHPASAPDGAPRIVSLAPNLTEIVCAVGGAESLVGRTDVCNRPSNVVARVPVVGGFGRPYLEPLLAQHPALVLEVDLEDKTMGATLDRLGIGHRKINCRHLTEIPDAIREVGRLTAHAAAGETLARSVENGIRERQTAAAAVPPAKRPLVYVEIWGDPLMTPGRDSFVSEAVALAGGRNLGDELPQDYATVSPEWVLTRNPDVILCLFMAPGGAGRQVMARHGWQNVRAVQQQRVYDRFDMDALLRPGPRVLEGVAQLCHIFEAFSSAANVSPDRAGPLAAAASAAATNPPPSASAP
jgi:iron complex transport system substrate-binding protein